MFGIGTGELMLIAAIAIIVLGPERCIRTFQTAGKLLRQIQTDWANAKESITTSVESVERSITSPLKTLPPVASKGSSQQMTSTHEPSVTEKLPH